MITLIKRLNKYLLYALVGVAGVFAMLCDLLSLTAATAYSSGTSYTVLLTFVMIFSVVLFALVPKFVIYIAYRIEGAIFLRKSGMLYPFPIPYEDFELTSLAFLLPGFLLCGVVMLPSLFFPTFARVLGAIRTVLIWGMLALIVRRFLKGFAHDYDKNTLAYSLTLIPMIIIGVSLALTLVEVLRR